MQSKLHEAIERAKMLIESTRQSLDEVGVESYHVYYVHAHFDSVLTELEKVNPPSVTKHEAKRLMGVLATKLPMWLHVYMRAIISQGAFAAAHDYAVDRYRIAVLDAVARVVTGQAMEKVQQRMQVAMQKPIAPMAAITAQGEGEIRFPAAPWISKEFTARWKLLSEQWFAAYSTATQIEDRFRLEQLASVHLPDSLRMFADLSDSTAEVKAEAEELLAKQLAAAERQIEISSQRHSEDALTALRAQTVFMQDIAQSHTSGLALPERSA